MSTTTRAVRGSIVADSPRATVVFAAAIVAGVYAFVLPLHLLLLDGRAQTALVALAAVTAMGCAGVAATARSGQLPDRLLAAAMAAVATVPMVNSMTHLAVTRQLQQTAVLMLTVVGIGAVVTRARLAFALVVVTIAAWVAIVVAERLGPASQTQHFAFGLAIAAALAYVVHGIHARDERRLVESHRRFGGVFADSPVGVALADEYGHFVEVNRALCTLLGRPPAELLGRSSRYFTHPDDIASHRAAQQLLKDATDGVVRIQKRYVRPDGSLVWGWLTITSVAGPNGENWTLAHIQDVTARIDVEQELRDSQADLKALAAVARCAQSGSDPRPVVLAAIRALSDAGTVTLFEREGDDLVATACEGVHMVGARVSLEATSATVHCYLTGESVFVPDTAASPLVNPAMQQQTGAASALFQPVVNDGVVIAVLAVGWTHPVTDLSARAIRVVTTLADETGAALTAGRLRALLEAQAVTDPMTGVANRRGWTEQVRRLTSLAARTGEPLTVALADLDHFKAYNDANGHDAGDRLLQRFAAAAVGAMRGVDVIARWGGEEFAFALPGCDLAAAGKVLERLRATLPEGATSSFGVALWDGAEPLDACVARADAAMYRAKSAGRNQVAS